MEEGIEFSVVWLQKQCSYPLRQYFPTFNTSRHVLQMIIFVRLTEVSWRGLVKMVFFSLHYKIMAWIIKYKVLQMTLNTNWHKWNIFNCQIQKVYRGIITKIFKHYFSCKILKYKNNLKFQNYKKLANNTFVHHPMQCILVGKGDILIKHRFSIWRFSQ